MRLRALLLAALLAAFALFASASAGAAEKRYKDDVFKISAKKDVVYGQGPATTYSEAEPLKLDLYRPKRDTVKKRPAIVWVHGGGFCCGDKSSGPAKWLAKDFARKGYVTVSINYRLLLETGCSGANGIAPECYEAAVEDTHDAQAAVRWLRANAKRLGVDKRRIGIGGESAGAIMSCGVAALSSQPGESGNPGPSSAVQSFVSISGGLPGGIFVDQNTAPGILFASTEDPVVPYAWSPETRDAIASFGIDAKLVSFASNVHVPYDDFEQQIVKQSTNSLYRNLDLANAKGS